MIILFPNVFNQKIDALYLVNYEFLDCKEIMFFWLNDFV